MSQPCYDHKHYHKHRPDHCHIHVMIISIVTGMSQSLVTTMVRSESLHTTMSSSLTQPCYDNNQCHNHLTSRINVTTISQPCLHQCRNHCHICTTFVTTMPDRQTGRTYHLATMSRPSHNHCHRSLHGLHASTNNTINNRRNIKR